MTLNVTIFLLLLASLIDAQDLTQSTISSAGGSIETKNQVIDWTLGESSTATVQIASGFLTQGFQQPLIRVEELVLEGLSVRRDIEVSIFPNPFLSEINLDIKSELEETINMNLIDASGKTILTKKGLLSNQISNVKRAQIPNGVYFLHLRAENDLSISTFQIIKTN